MTLNLKKSLLNAAVQKVYNMYLGTFAMFENRVRAIISYHTTSMAAAFRKKALQAVSSLR